MKYFDSFFKLIVLVFPFTVAAQGNNWDSYRGQYEKGPGSTALDMSIKKMAPVKELPFLLVTGVAISDCDSVGMPKSEAFPLLYRVSAAVKLLVDSSIKNMLVGSFTYQCERHDYYYVRDTFLIRKKLQKFYRDSFPNQIPYISLRLDKIWQSYLDFLYPNARSMEFMINEKLLLELIKAGDQQEKERPIDHYLYFNTESDQQNFIDYEVKQHFKVLSKQKVDSVDHPFKLVISRKDKTELAAISEITIELKRMAMKCNGFYDRWETAVVK